MSEKLRVVTDTNFSSRKLARPFIQAGIDPELIANIALDFKRGQEVLANGLKLRTSFDPIQA